MGSKGEMEEDERGLRGEWGNKRTRSSERDDSRLVEITISLKLLKISIAVHKRYNDTDQ